MRRGTMVAALAAAATLTSAGSALGAWSGAIPWSPDYSGGTLADWQGIQEPAAGRLTVTASPSDPTVKVMRVELRHGDVYTYNGQTSNRSEVLQRHGDTGSPSQNWPDGDGTERWYSWSTFFAPGFPNTNQWAAFFQWHNDSGDQPPLSMGFQAGRIRLVTPQGALWIDPNVTATGVWHTFKAHIVWSAVPTVGFLELWVDGTSVYAANRATEQCCLQYNGVLLAPWPNYVKMGMYRDPAITGTAILYDTPLRIGATEAQVTS